MRGRVRSWLVVVIPLPSLLLVALLAGADAASAGLLDEVVPVEPAPTPVQAVGEPPIGIGQEVQEAPPSGGFSLIPRKKNLGLFLAAQTVIVMDMAQTLDIRHHPELEEANPIFGREPSDGRVYAIFGTRLVVNTLAYWLLPDRWANAVSMVNLVVGIPVVARNASLGLSFSF